jgi:hypothetical protein
VTKRDRKRLAEALLDPSSTAQYLLSRLGGEWEAVTPAVLMKLGKRYGAAVVTDALRSVRMMDTEAERIGGAALVVRNPVGYLEGVCSGIGTA